jgi:hypothetical protein
MAKTPSDVSESSRPQPKTAQRYHGGCHCGAVRYEVELDLAGGTIRCNCSWCSKVGHWGVIVKPEAFTLVSGKDSLTDYQFSAKISHQYFCKRCGIRSFSQGCMAELGGDFYSINLNCVDSIDLSDVIVRHFDGRNDNWENPRVERTAGH